MKNKTPDHKENVYPKHPQQSSRLKVVVRCLPPSLSEQTFRELTEKWLFQEQIEWFSFYPGKVSSNRSKNDTYSRAYIKFKSLEALITFYKGFGGYLFKDEKGKEQRVLIEFAPFQKIPRLEKQKHDIRQGTIDEDPEYIAFQEALKNPNKDQEYNKYNDDDTVPIDAITPLIEYLRTQKETNALKSKQQQKKNALEKKTSAQAKADAITTQIRSQGGLGSMKKFNKDRNKFHREPNNSDARKESSMRPEELYPRQSNSHKRVQRNIMKKESSVATNTSIKILKPSNREKHFNSNTSNREKTHNSSQPPRKADSIASSTNKNENEHKKNTRKYYDYTKQSTQRESKNSSEHPFV